MADSLEDTPIGAEVARLTKTAALSEESSRPRSLGSEIHTDDYARGFGFESALVPGVTAMGYVTELLNGVFGEAWMERGKISVRFRRPVYDGETVVAKAVLKDRRREDGAVVLDVTLESGVEGRVAVVGEATCTLDRQGEGPCGG